jgi:hypothetical protein
MLAIKNVILNILSLLAPEFSAAFLRSVFPFVFALLPSRCFDPSASPSARPLQLNNILYSQEFGVFLILVCLIQKNKLRNGSNAEIVDYRALLVPFCEFSLLVH